MRRTSEEAIYLVVDDTETFEYRTKLTARRGDCIIILILRDK